VSAVPACEASVIPAVLRGAEDDGSRVRRRRELAAGGPTQRERLVAAMGEAVAEIGASTIGVHHVCRRAGMSRRTFYELYTDREACFLDALQEAYGQLLSHVEAAVAAAGPAWEDRVVSAMLALIVALDGDRVLARLCVIAAKGDSQAAVRMRCGALDRITGLLADTPDLGPPADAMLSGALGGVWELVYRRLVDEPTRPVGELADAAVYLMLAPFVGRRRAAARAADARVATAHVSCGAPSGAGRYERGLVVTELTRQTLSFLAEHAGAANVDVARAVSVRHESQISRHLGRLKRAGMVSCQKHGRANAWWLTDQGRQAARALTPDPSSSHKQGALLRT
jgi:AcrR family transcriptional regulator